MSDAYYTEIEGHFALRRATPFILSAKDWVLMKKWHDDGIPLPVVIEAIDSVFEKNESSGRRKVISSLSYCRHAVKELWNERKELAVGAHESTPEAGPEPLLEALALQLEASGVEAAAAIAPQIRSLMSEKTVPAIEERLIEIESALLERIAATIDVAAIRREISASLGDTSKLDAKTHARTEEANLRRIIRERFGLPRLTLFS